MDEEVKNPLNMDGRALERGKCDFMKSAIRLGPDLWQTQLAGKQGLLMNFGYTQIVSRGERIDWRRHCKELYNGRTDLSVDRQGSQYGMGFFQMRATFYVGSLSSSSTPNNAATPARPHEVDPSRPSTKKWTSRLT